MTSLKSPTAGNFDNRNFNMGDSHQVQSPSSVFRKFKKNSSNKQNVPCPNCFKGFTTKSSMERHCEKSCGKNNNPDAKFRCKNCVKGYKSQGSLTRHLKNECGKEPQFICPFCERSFGQNSSLVRHIKLSCKALKSVLNDNSFIRRACVVRHIQQILKPLRIELNDIYRFYRSDRS